MTLEEINILVDRISYWFEISTLDLAENGYIDDTRYEIRKIRYNAEEMSIFNRLKNKLNYYESYLTTPDIDDVIRKSNVFKHIHRNRNLVKVYYDGFEVKISLKTIRGIMRLDSSQWSAATYSDVIIHYKDLLQFAIERFHLTLKQDNILDNYTFKAAFYNDSYCSTQYMYYKIHILLLNTKELKTVVR